MFGESQEKRSGGVQKRVFKFALVWGTYQRFASDRKATSTTSHPEEKKEKPLKTNSMGKYTWRNCRHLGNVL